MTPGRRSLAAIAIWVGTVAVARWWATALLGQGEVIRLGAAPLYGAWDLLLTWRVVPAVAVSGAMVALGPRLAAWLPWRGVLAGAGAAAVIWAVSLALIDGTDALVEPLRGRLEYLSVVPAVDDVGEFLSTFTERRLSYPLHVKGHPPGMVLALVGLDRLGLGGAGWAASLVTGGGAAAVIAVLVAVGDLAGRAQARAAAPFVALLPAAVYASSADSFFAGVGLAGLAFFVVATGRTGRAGDVHAAVAGVLLGVVAHLSYGLVLLGLPVVVVALARRRVRPLVVAGAGALAVLMAFVAAGFWWWEGLEETKGSYYRGVGGRRPYASFVFINLGAFALTLGPSVAVALSRLRDRGVWLLVGSGLAVVAMADLSGLSKGEVERIWLFLAFPVATAAASLALDRRWLVVHVAAGLVLQAWLRTSW